MDKINILDEIYLTRFISDYGNWTIPTLSHCIEKVELLLGLKFMYISKLLYGVYLTRFIGEVETYIKVEVCITRVTVEY